MNYLFLFFTLLCLNIYADEINRDQKIFAEYLGYLFWSEIKNFQSEDFTFDSVVEGMKKAQNGASIEMDSKVAEEHFLNLLFKEEEKKANENLRQSILKLQEIAKKEGIVSLENGKLFIEILQKSEGRVINEAGFFHLKGYYLNGDFFIDTILQKPVYQELNDAIEGFRLGIRGMKEGEKRRLYIHPELAYGKYDLSHPNQMVIIEVELVSFK